MDVDDLTKKTRGSKTLKIKYKREFYVTKLSLFQNETKDYLSLIDIKGVTIIPSELSSK